MREWIVYSKDGRTERCVVKNLEYSGSWMGECSVSVTLDSPAPVEFEIGDYLVYRGERFEINYDPTVVKSASVYASADGFRYEGVKFNSLSDELTRCDFLDYVPSDNLIHYSSLPNFSFFAEGIKDLTDRIQVNLDRVYTGSKRWTIELAEGIESKKNVNITASNMTCWDALALVKSQFGVNFIVKNRRITIGTEGFVVEKMFSYGKGNGLVTIEKNAESDQKVVTRLRAYGSTKNMPMRYYYNQGEGIVPNNLAVQNLMLPSFPTETLDPYIDSKNISELGVREGVVFFDGSGEQEDIYPSMEGMTAEELKAAGISVNATGALDEVVSAEAIEDNGIIPDEGELKGIFKMTIKDIGFDINEHLSTESATISIKTGMCGGREFEIAECKKTDEGYELTCNRSEDSGLGLVFPYKDYPIKAGDKFVLLNIEMPDVYIKAASQRLLEAATAYLAKNDYVRYSYTPKLDSVFLARQHDKATKNGQKSIYANIKEGDLLMFEDGDLGIEGSVIIDTLSIKEGDSLIPEFEITLRNDKAVGTIEKIQNQIDSIVSGGTAISGGAGGGGYNSSQIKSMIKAVGETLFLSKIKDDKTPHSLGVGKNLEMGGDIAHKEFSEGSVGGGYRVAKNGEGQYEAEADRLVARVMAKVYDLLVENHASFVGSLSSEEFVSGFTGGKGWAIRVKEWLNAVGVVEKKSVAEFDEVIVRGAMRVYEFIISQMLGENDNRIFTGMMEVDHYDAGEGKIYLKTGDGRLYNPFRADDIVIVQQYCGNPSENNGYYVTKQYEFIVTEAGVGEGGEERLDWVKFRNFTTSMEGGDESLIVEHDTLVRIDNLSDMSRKGIIQLMSVGEDTPYMDFVYGAKTDPENSLKGRLGNLGGVYNPLFGWLKEFGAYLTNLYAVGEFVIAHTGEDVSDAIEIAKSGFRTNYRQTTYDMTEEQNFLTNASMTNNCEGWTLGEDFSDYFLVDGLPQYFNYDLYVSEKTYAGLAKYNDRDMLRVFSSSARQENSLIRKPSTHKVYTGVTENEDGSSESVYTEEIDTIYLNIRFYCHASGELEVGFVDVNGVFYDNVFHSKKDYVADIDAYTISVSGKWDGMGDFYIKTTGDFYVDLLSLTDKPLDNYMITTSTAIEQDAARISLLGKKVNGVEGSVTELALIVNAQEGTISSLVETTDSINNTIKTAGWINRDNCVEIFAGQVTEQGLATKAEMEVYVDGIVSGIRISADQIDMTANDYISIINKGTTTIAAERVDLKGKVTFSMLDTETQDNIDSKVDQDAVNDSIDDFKGTIIEGGKIKTELLYVTEIEATKGYVGGFTIGEKSLTNDDADAYISVGDLTGTSFVSINAPSASGALSVRRDDGVAVSIYTHGSEGVGLRINGQTGAKTIESYGSSVLAARKGSSPYEVVTIAGLALSYKNGKDFSVASNSVFDSVNSVWADFLVATGDVTLPSASSCQGKILFVKFMGNYTISSASPIVDGSSMETLYTKTYNERSVFFLNDGIRWYAFDGWYK